MLINGSPHGFFRPSRGLRQGDPLSPFLSILGSEVLSRMLEQEERQGSIHSVKVSWAAPFISHLLFADDLLIFSRANVQEANQILIVLEEYSQWLGQRVNLAKSALFCSSNTHPVVIEEICIILQVKKLGLDSKYLGLPPLYREIKEESIC